MLGYKFKDDCFEYTLIEKQGIIGWHLECIKGVMRYRCNAMEKGYPVISLRHAFANHSLYEHITWDDDTIDVSGMDTSNVTDMSYMFSNYEGSIQGLCCFDTSKVTDMTCMFSHCGKTSFFDPSEYEYSDEPKYGSCQLDLSSFRTDNVRNMSHMFWGYSIERLDLSSFNTSNVTNMSYMFSECNIGKLDLSSFNTNSVTNMYRMFFACCVGEFVVCNAEIAKEINK